MNAERQTLLVVDDEPDFAAGLVRLLKLRFPELDIQSAASGPEALATVERARPGPVDALVTDLRMPGMDGLELLEQVRSARPETSVVLLTAHGDIETAVRALKAGAYDFLTKPVDPDTLARTVVKALERGRLLSENRRLMDLAGGDDLDRALIGESPAMRRLKASVAAAAAADYDVLIRGESGTGKELVARSIHRLSRRGGARLVSINCPAIPEQLLESELFGHVKGAFTGADKPRRGLFLTASGGALFLDEIGDVSQNIQTRLLRVLQEREIRPVGSSQSLPVDVRVIASTNRDLETAIRNGTFREDLYYRLNVLTLRTPPLRERPGDVPLLAARFLSETCRELGLPSREFAPEALATLAARPWPGNVRELQNVVRRAVVFGQGALVDLAALRLADGALQADDRPCGGVGGEEPEDYKTAKDRAVEAFTKCYVEELLRRTGGNVSEAARISGLERQSLQKILKRNNIDASGYR